MEQQVFLNALNLIKIMDIIKQTAQQMTAMR